MVCFSGLEDQFLLYQENEPVLTRWNAKIQFCPNFSLSLTCGHRGPGHTSVKLISYNGCGGFKLILALAWCDLASFVILALAWCDLAVFVLIALAWCDLAAFVILALAWCDLASFVTLALAWCDLASFVLIALAWCDLAAFVLLALAWCDLASFVLLALAWCDLAAFVLLALAWCDLAAFVLLALAWCDVQRLCSPSCSGMVRRVESGVPRVFFHVQQTPGVSFRADAAPPMCSSWSAF